MSPAGNIGEFGVSIQATKGTPSATALQTFYLTGGGLASDPEITDYAETTGKTVRSGAYIARVRGAGTPQFYARPAMLGPFLFGAFGAKSASAGPDPFLHTFTIASALPYLTLWKSLGGILFERFHDCKLASLTLRSVEGAPLIAEANVLALHATSQAADDVAGVTVDVSVPFVHHDASAALKVETVAVAHASSVIVTIATGATIIAGDSLEGYSIEEGIRVITVEMQQLVTDAQLWNRLHYGSANPADNAAPTRSVVTLGGAPAGIDLKWLQPGGGAERSLQATATNVTVKSIAGVEHNVNGDPLKATVTYQAYDVAAGSAMTAILKNGVATYTAN
jgi:hypothetical protein